MIRINLLDYRKERKIRKIKWELLVFYVCLLLSFIIMGLIRYNQNVKIRELDLEVDRAENEVSRLKELVKDVAKVEKTEVRLKQILRVITQLKSEQDKPVKLIDKINVSLPRDVWLTKIEQGEKEIKISGVSFSNPAIAYFMRRLENLNLFEQVELIESAQKLIIREKVKSFSLRCILKVDREELVEELKG